MKLFTFGGDFWARLAKRSRRFQLADMRPEQTHVNHALVIILLFGTVGAGLGKMAEAFNLLEHGLDYGFRVALFVGLIYYLLREIDQRLDIASWNRITFQWWDNPWDGVCDIVVPCWITLPVVFGSLLLLWILTAVVAILYFLLRPVPAGGFE